MSLVQLMIPISPLPLPNMQARSHHHLTDHRGGDLGFRHGGDEIWRQRRVIGALMQGEVVIFSSWGIRVAIGSNCFFGGAGDARTRYSGFTYMLVWVPGNWRECFWEPTLVGGGGRAFWWWVLVVVKVLACFLGWNQGLDSHCLFLLPKLSKCAPRAVLNKPPVLLAMSSK